jgi:hypothetical protein
VATWQLQLMNGEDQQLRLIVLISVCGTFLPPLYHAYGNHSTRDIKEVCSVNMDV